MRRRLLLNVSTIGLVFLTSFVAACVSPGPPPEFSGAPSGSRVAIFGDDTIASARSALHEKLDPLHRSSIVGLPGARVAQLQSTASYYAALHPEHVVIDLGAQDLRAGTDRATVLTELANLVELFPSTTCVHVSGLDIVNPLDGYRAQASRLSHDLAALRTSHTNVRFVAWPQIEVYDDSMSSPSGPLMDGWRFSTEGARQFAVAVEASIEGCAAPAQITTVVYDDANGDGVRQPGEPGVDGVVVRLLADWLALPGYETLNDYRVTTNGGQVVNDGLVPGEYVVMPEDPYLPIFTADKQKRVTVAAGGTYQAEIAFHDTGPRLAILGDSITYLARDTIRTALEPGHQVQVWARSMQLLRDTQPIADAFGTNQPPQVIINLGTNDVSQGSQTIEADLRRMIETFPSSLCVHVTTTSELNPSQEPGATALNNTIRLLPSDYPNVRVIDWSKILHDHEADPHGEGPLLDSGNIHPTALGQQYLANAYAAAVASCE